MVQSGKVSLVRPDPNLDPSYREAKYGAGPVDGVEYRVFPHPYTQYDASSEGEVISWTTYGRRVLNPTVRSKDGYLCMCLRNINTGKQHVVSPAVLVLTAFTGPAPEGMKVKYLDKDRSNLRPSNLYWGSPDTRPKKERVPNPIPRLSAEDSARFSAAMKTERRRADMSQKQVADLVGCATTVVGRWERGGRRFNVGTVHKVLSVLGFEFEYEECE